MMGDWSFATVRALDFFCFVLTWMIWLGCLHWGLLLFSGCPRDMIDTKIPLPFFYLASCGTSRAMVGAF